MRLADERSQLLAAKRRLKPASTHAHEPPRKPLNLEEAVGTADHANHAKPERLGGEDRFTQRVRAFVSLTPSFFVYSVYSAV
jgi:hypothetical protein